MNLKKQIGQLMVIGYQGLEPSDAFLSFVEEWGIGGIIVFVRNIGADPTDLKRVIQKIEKASGQTIFTSIDQEGGLVLRILKTGSLFPGAMGLAASRDESVVQSVSKALAMEMRAVGLNWNLAPVLDINHPDNPCIGARAFGEDPQTVTKYGLAAIRGFREGGLLSCVKHFPGLGHANVDSHLSLPTIPYTREHLLKHELYPFAEAFKAGADAVMTSHVFFPAFESTPNLPGTLSKAVLSDLLRTQMGFKGLLITDDMEMGAITETWGVPEACRLAFLAGSDQLLICHDLERERQAAQTLHDEVLRNPEARRRLDESLERIATARRTLESLKVSPKSLAELAQDHAPLISEAYEKSVVTVRSAPGRLPLKPATNKVFLCPEVSALVQIEEEQKGDGIGKIVQESFPQATCLTYHPKSEKIELLKAAREAIAKAGSVPDIVVLSYNAHLFAGAREAFGELAREHPTLVLAAIRNPYDVDSIPQAATALATFGFRSPAIKALLKKLHG